VSQGVDSHVGTRPEEYTSISLCSGYGGIEIALRQAIRTRTLCYVEIGVEVCEILVNLMEQELIDEAPIWTDLTNFPVDLFRDRVDIVQGGFPCQPFSVAGLQKGTEDPRNLWPSVSRVIRGIRPSVVFLENVPGILPYYFETIRPELVQMGYVVTEGLFSAGVDGGAPQRRQRLFILAYSEGTRLQRRGIPRHLTDYLDELALFSDNGHLGSPIGRGQPGEVHDGGEEGENGAGQPERVRSARDASQQVAHTEGRDVGKPIIQGSDGREAGVPSAGEGDGCFCREDGESTGLADTECGATERCGYEMEGTPPANQGTGHQRQRIRPDTGDGGDELAHAFISNDSRIFREGELCESHEGGSRWERNAQTGSRQPTELPLFPPGPNDARGWEWVLSRWPQLSPTYCKEGHDVQPDLSAAPSRVCGMADGSMSGVDKRLRAVGNGVVPITCALAFHTLGRGRIF